MNHNALIEDVARDVRRLLHERYEKDPTEANKAIADASEIVIEGLRFSARRLSEKADPEAGASALASVISTILVDFTRFNHPTEGPKEGVDIILDAAKRAAHDMIDGKAGSATEGFETLTIVKDRRDYA